jgi:flagellar hook-length control protein FliK
MTVTPMRTTEPAPATKAGATSAAHPHGGQPDGTALGFLAELAAAVTSIGGLAQVTGALPGTVPTEPAPGSTPSGSGLPAAGALLSAGTSTVGMTGAGTPAATAPAASTVTGAAPVIAASVGATAGATAAPVPAASPTTPPALTPAPGEAPAAGPAGQTAVHHGLLSAHPVAGGTHDAGTSSQQGQSDTPADARPETTPIAPDAPTATTPTAGVDTPALATAPAPAPATPTAAPAGTHPPRTAAVLEQVFPEISKLSTAGNGTQRMTLTLHPQDLGTVRVTLTVRDGSVQVSLASDQATSSLVQGSGDLHRLLEAQGVVDSRVVVRDLASGVVAADSSSGTGGQAGDRQPQGQQQPQPGDTGQTGQAGGRSETGGQARREADPGSQGGQAERPAAYAVTRDAATDTDLARTTPPTLRRSGVDQLI